VGSIRASGKDDENRRRQKEISMKVFMVVLASALLIAPAAMLAQTPTPGANDHINQRKIAQQDRIANASRAAD
jgi:hypothetical protein